MGAIVRLLDVHAAYGREAVLVGVKAEVHPGERVAVVGPNGAGKSTLLKVMLGLVPHAVGYVEVAGERVVPGKPPSRAAYVPQHASTILDMPVTVWDVVAMGRIGRPGRRRFLSRRDREAIAAALEAVGLAELRNRRFGDLSGGQRQRALIARALVREAPVLFLDEPVTGLDVPTQDSVRHLVDGLSREGVAVIQVTHELDASNLRLYHRIWCVNRRLIGEGTYEEVRRSGALAAAFGLPAEPGEKEGAVR
ncbi:MAG: metal ABC transporter ATP-binding protein [Alicyclobacillaceae bacterium]|nr:metal ABC transporter ATP-binding protein [Alicyclobacillaceae bacterium]